ncbi:unnamed protein product [Fraxinus pennsylvanica]|uniref:Phytocyanin domain-containing protein n=1 Tax=Fraxinus pennsylvanica TaxID=56036 RepID=A0AAD2E3J1_9LAMI|nr:unnamed protein product [Fraxinus pennsylvanica]
MDSALFVILFFACFTCTSFAYQFNVGGKTGWVVNPSENYNNWAGRMRFQVNDTLLFKYKKGMDSVLVVNKDDYEKCNTEKPIIRMEDGNSVFKFDRSGPFYFISGNKGNCDKGQKMIIVVLAVRNYNKPPFVPVPGKAPPPKGGAGHAPSASPPKGSYPGSPLLSPGSPSGPAMSPFPAGKPPPTALTPGLSPSPAGHGNVPSPGSTSPSPSPAGHGNVPYPGTTSPSPSPAGVPYPGTTSPSPSPASHGNVPSPTATSPSTGGSATSPSISPSPANMQFTPATSPSPSTVTPSTPGSISPSPSSTTPGLPGVSPPGTNGTSPSSGNNTANDNTNGGSQSSMSTVSLILSVALLSLLN